MFWCLGWCVAVGICRFFLEMQIGIMGELGGSCVFGKSFSG